MQGTCGRATTCSRCGALHDHGACSTEAVKYPNCSGARDANSKECSRLRKEIAVLKRKPCDHSKRREVAAVLRRKSSRQRRGTEVTARSRESLRPSQVTPVVASVKESSSKLLRPTRIPDHRLTTKKMQRLGYLSKPRFENCRGMPKTQKREEIAESLYDATKQ